MKDMKHSFTRLHNYYFSTKGCMKAKVLGFPMENFSKLIFKYMQFQGIFSYFEQNKNQYCEKTNLIYFFSLKT